MVIGDDIAAALPELRAQAESLMRDSCVVERRTGRVMDDTSLEYVDSWSRVYEGRCRVQVAATQPAEEVVGGRAFVVTDAVVQLPVGPVDFADDDRVTVTSTAYDPALVGVVLSVTSREVKTHPVMRRLHVSEVRS